MLGPLIQALYITGSDQVYYRECTCKGGKVLSSDAAIREAVFRPDVPATVTNDPSYRFPVSQVEERVTGSPPYFLPSLQNYIKRMGGQT